MRNFEVIIVGGGVSGSALAYTLAKYSDIASIAVLEKYEDLATLNSAPSSNSQTLHCGDIETNYTLAKALRTKRTANMIVKYCLEHGYDGEILHSHTKMALGIGKDEVEFLLDRYDEFGEHFPYLEVWDKERLKKIEPDLIYDENGVERCEEVLALGAMGEWTTLDFGKLSHSFIENAQNTPHKCVELFLNTEVLNIEKSSKRGYKVSTKNESYYADFVVVNAGAHSLYLAHKMGHGKEFASLSVAGSFYLSNKQILNSKVYMIQNPKLPFAALHGDPDLLTYGLTRFGPTALILPKLERYRSGSVLEFFRTLNFDANVLKALLDLLKDRDIRNYIATNFLYEIPLLGKKLFAKEARKIVPSISENDITYAKGFGGIRPQVIDKNAKKLLLGEACIYSGEGVIFNMTPSPGATSCLGNAQRDALYLCKYLGKQFDDDRFVADLSDGESCTLPSTTAPQKEMVNRIRSQLAKTEQKYMQDLHHNKPEGSFWQTPHSKL